MARTKGSTNKNKDRLWKALQAEYGEDFDPILRMAEIATKEENDDTLKLSAWKEIAQYVYPKLKAVELTGEDGGPVQMEEVRRTIVDPEHPDS